MESELSFLLTFHIKLHTVWYKEESRRFTTNTHCLLVLSECVRSLIVIIKAIHLPIFLLVEYACATKAGVRFDHNLLLRKLFFPKEGAASPFFRFISALAISRE
ncbi:MAG: hypothetical protein C9356_02785 [Oleiphilus sp.]|nr:MAG: hypothetical protein C9356_02785 [Oleiphilus sp.]